MKDQAAKSAEPLGRVLVVDDNDDNRQVLSRRLRRQGYAVDVANDGPAALDACSSEAYDAVLLDVMMPGMSGIEVLERLRATRAKTELPVIMATAKTDSIDVVDALKRGANDYVTKPIDFPVLLARLETHLAMKTEADQRSGSVIDVTLGIQPGTVLDGRYEILEKQGEGGFAVVYRATQISTQQEVALKHARPDVMRADEDGVHLERFKREVSLIGQMSHGNIVRLIDSGSIPVRRALGSTARPSEDEPPSTRIDSPHAAKPTSDQKEVADGAGDRAASRTRRRQGGEGDEHAIEVPYIVMEFLRGESLAEHIAREAPLDPHRAVDLILPVVSALAAAHAQGVVHRDVKPSNIMLAEMPGGAIEPKVLDFGIAKLTEAGAQALTVSASLIGTPQYMAPEQAWGRKDIDARADQFAVAAVLYEMLTGRSLYRGESFLELVAKVLSGDFLPIVEARSDLPPGLVEVVGKALSPERDHRYDSLMALGLAFLPHATPAAALRWADRFGADETLRSSLAPANGGGSSSLPPRMEARGAKHVTITTGDTSSPTDSTVQLSIDSLPARTLGEVSNEQTSAAEAPETAPPAGPLVETATESKATPWGWIALVLALAVAAAIVARAL